MLKRIIYSILAVGLAGVIVYELLDRGIIRYPADKYLENLRRRETQYQEEGIERLTRNPIIIHGNTYSISQDGKSFYDSKSDPVPEDSRVGLHIKDKVRFPESEHITHVDSQEQLEEIIRENYQQGNIVFALYSRTRCAPCGPAHTVYREVVEEKVKEYKEKNPHKKLGITFLTITLDDLDAEKCEDVSLDTLSKETRKFLDIQAVPTLLVFYPDGFGYRQDSTLFGYTNPHWVTILTKGFSDSTALNTKPFKEYLEEKLKKIKN